MPNTFYYRETQFDIIYANYRMVVNNNTLNMLYFLNSNKRKYN